MDELKCKECGTILQHDTKVCPVCGCPVDEIASEAVNGTVEVKGDPVIGNVMPETPKADTKPPVKEADQDQRDVDHRSGFGNRNYRNGRKGNENEG